MNEFQNTFSSLSCYWNKEIKFFFKNHIVEIRKKNHLKLQRVWKLITKNKTLTFLHSASPRHIYMPYGFVILTLTTDCCASLSVIRVTDKSRVHSLISKLIIGLCIFFFP